MNLWLGWLSLLLLATGLEAGWNDIVDKFNQVQNALSRNDPDSTIQPLPSPPPRILESIQHMDVNKLKAGLEKLKKRANDRIKKKNKTKNNGGDEQKVMQRIQNKVTEKSSQRRVKDTGDNIHQINTKFANDDVLYQKDIILSQQQLDEIFEDDPDDDVPDQELQVRRRRQAEAQRSGLWPDNQVYYYFDSSIGNTARQAILGGIAFWQNNTCINFQESRTARNRIRFAALDGCYSMVGCITGQQDVSIGTGCESVGTVAHELGHALGFWHQMSRYDRDDYITLDFSNVDPQYYGQFDKETSRTNYNYGMPYDWASIMQYGATSASFNGKPSMIAKDLNYQDAMGSDIVAFYDVSMMNERYGCKAKCPAATSAQCYNGGYAHPRNCAVCSCPRGFGGPQCGDRAQIGDCGDYLQATTTPQNLSVTVDSQSGPTAALVDKECSYVIYADQGMRIEAKIVSLVAPSCIDGCIYGGLELKAASDIKMSGYRYCCRADVNTVITSTFNVLPVINWSRFSTSSFTISYRAVPGASSSQNEPPRLTILNNLGDGPPSTTTTTFLPPTTTTTRCRDRSKMCMAWQYYFNFCRNYPLLFQKSYCQKTCGLCH